MVFVGGVDQKVHYYELDIQTPNSKMTYKFSLSGHENAITKLAITKHGQDILLATASKDGYIRLWKITNNPD
jgi:WD40 repeat protein